MSFSLSAEIDEDDFIDRMNKAHQFATHGFSHDGLKALFKYFKDEYYAVKNFELSHCRYWH
jgi:hypothetical protein